MAIEAGVHSHLLVAPTNRSTHTHTQSSDTEHTVERKRGSPNFELTLTFPLAGLEQVGGAGTITAVSWQDLWWWQPCWRALSGSEEVAESLTALLERRWGCTPQ